MMLVVRPRSRDDELAVIRVALERAGLRLDEHPEVYANSWRSAALREAVDDELEMIPYAPSPRSTRGATRA
jgi:hypothetical protein